MGLVVSGLTEYIKQNEDFLMTKALYSNKSASLLFPMPNVKNGQNVNLMDTNVVIQDGSSCALNASGSTTFSARTLKVANLAIYETYCLRDLNTKYLSLLMQAGSNYDEMPNLINEKLVSQITGDIANKMETLTWRGDTTVTGFLGRTDGLVKIIASASGVVNANTTAFQTSVVTAIPTSSNIISIIDGLYRAIPIEILDNPELRLVMGVDTYRTYQLALKNANLFNYVPNNDINTDYVHPGTMLKITAVNGLNGTGFMYAGVWSTNGFYGFDVADEQSFVKTEYLEFDGLLRIRMDWKAGYQVGIPSEIVKFTF